MERQNSRGSRGVASPTVSKRAQQEAYRAELMQQMREAEARKAEQKRKDDADKFMDAPAGKVFPWENTLSRKVGGGGDPVKDLEGNVITDLKEVLSPSERNTRERSNFLRQVSSFGRKQRPPNIETPQYSPHPANVDYAIENGNRDFSRNPSFGSPMSQDMQNYNYNRSAYDRHHQPSPTGSTSSRVSSRSRITRLDSGFGEEVPAVITFAKGSEVATFKVEGMSLRSFEKMLQMWDTHQQNGNAAFDR